MASSSSSSSSTASSSSSKTTFPLYGYERFFAMAPNASARLAFVLTLRGDVATLLANLPLAVMHTFNQHPKMRACLLPGVVPQTAMVCAPLVDVSELHEKLFTVEWRADYDANATEWMQFVQNECETPVDREQQWPFAVRVFADKTSQRFARIVLLADHYMADASTGAIVMNTILQHAATVSASGGSSTASATREAMPLVPSLYECMHSRTAGSSWMGVFHEAVAKWVLEPLFHFDHAAFTPALAIDKATQQHFQGRPPSPANPSQALFAQGTAANMQRALAKCEDEGVSLQGAMTAATMLAFGLAQRHGDLRATTVPDSDTATSSTTEPGKITMKTDVSLDLRDRYAARLGRDSHAVGLYSTSGNLVFTGSEGASIHDSFWDLARKSDREWRETRDGHELTLQSLYVHETLTAESLTQQSGSLEVQNCVLSDATLSTTTLYTYPHEVTLHKAHEGSPPTTTTLHVETYHVYNSLPSLSSACVVFLSGVSSFNYSLMAKLEHGLAQELLHWFTETMEHVGEIHECDSLLQVSDKLTRFAAVAPPPTAAAAPVGCSV